MANAGIDPSRLYTILDRTSTRSKDPVLYQLLYNLIGSLVDVPNTATKAVEKVITDSGGIAPSNGTESIINQYILIGGDDGGGGGGDVVPGPPGLAGNAGATGPQGPIGIPGLDGIDGELFAIPGGMGPTGNAGATGPQGAIGWPGEDGVDADLFPIPGPMGPTGNIGPAGPAGSSGSGVAPVRNEIPTGSINGTNKVFTTAANYAQLAVYLNGLRLKKTTHYTETTSNTFTLVDAPITGDVVMVDYGGEGGAAVVTAGAGLLATGVVLDVIPGDGLQTGPDILDLKLDGPTLVKSSTGLKVAPSPAIGVSVYRTTNLTISVVPGDPTATLPFEVVKFDPDGSWSVANPTRLTCKAAGKYIIVGQYTVQTLTGTGGSRIWLYKNGVTQLASAEYRGDPIQCVVEEELAAGDYVELIYKVTEFAGSTRSILSGAGITFFQMLLVPPSTVATGGGGGGSAGALTLLETHTVSGASTIDFITRNATGQTGASFQTDYDDYMFSFINVLASAGIGLYLSTNGGSSYDTNSSNYVSMNQYSTSANGSGTGGGLGLSITAINMLNASDIGLTGKFYFYSPAVVGLQKSFDGHMTYRSGVSGNPHIQCTSSIVWYASTAAVNAIRFWPTGGGSMTGTIRMYGLAKS